MVDFKETAKDIFNICTNISKSDGRATEKIEEILRDVYMTDRPLMLTDNGAKKAILVLMLHQAGVPKSIMNTTRMKFEPLDIEKIADYLLDNGVDIVNPYSKLFESCLESIENQLADMYGVDTIEFENPKEFTQHYCHNCGSQRCEGVGTPWFEGCHHKEHLKDYEKFYGDE